jgi:RNA polymerase sigma-70 factor (ECF subfamily)
MEARIAELIPRLRRYARSLLFDPSAADDLVQTALERALAHWHQFDQRRDILVWVLSIAHNAHMDERRRHSHLMAVEPLDLQDGPGAVAATLPDPGLRMDLLAALARLPVEQRAAVVLVDISGYPVSEAAAILGVPEGTVKSRCARARARLAPLLASLRNPDLLPAVETPTRSGEEHP